MAVASIRPRLIGGMPLLLPLLLLLPEGGYVPVFDGRVYADRIVKLASEPSLLNLNGSGHPMQAYLLLTAAIQSLRPASTWLLLASHLVLLTVSLAAFAGILSHLFPEPGDGPERMLALLALAAHPALLACTLQPNPDLAVLAGTLLTVDALLARRRLRLALSGLFLVFSKEIGLLLLPAIAVVYAAVFIVRPALPLREKLRGVGSLWPVAVPLAVAAARLAIRLGEGAPLFVTPPGSPSGTLPILREFLGLRLLDGTFRSYAAGICVMQFQWLLSLVLLAWVVARISRRVFAVPTDDSERRRPVVFAIALFVVTFVLVTRYRTYSSPRYWLSAYPLMLLAAAAALRDLKVQPTLRRGFLALVGVLWLLSVHRTVDPVSRLVYGTFAFGEHAMLRTSSITAFAPERQATGGRDGLVYNLQFANIHHLQNAVIASLGDSRVTPHLVDLRSLWHLWDTVDRRGRRTLDPNGVELPELLIEGSAGALRLRGKAIPLRAPPECVYVVYPMFAAFQYPLLADLSRVYAASPPLVVAHAGYTAEVYRLRLDPRRSAGALAPAPATPPPR